MNSELTQTVQRFFNPIPESFTYACKSCLGEKVAMDITEDGVNHPTHLMNADKFYWGILCIEVACELGLYTPKAGEDRTDAKPIMTEIASKCGDLALMAWMDLAADRAKRAGN